MNENLYKLSWGAKKRLAKTSEDRELLLELSKLDDLTIAHYLCKNSSNTSLEIKKNLIGKSKGINTYLCRYSRYLNRFNRIDFETIEKLLCIDDLLYNRYYFHEILLSVSNRIVNRIDLTDEQCSYLISKIIDILMREDFAPIGNHNKFWGAECLYAFVRDPLFTYEHFQKSLKGINNTYLKYRSPHFSKEMVKETIKNSSIKEVALCIGTSEHISEKDIDNAWDRFANIPNTNKNKLIYEISKHKLTNIKLLQHLSKIDSVHQSFAQEMLFRRKGLCNFI